MFVIGELINGMFSNVKKAIQEKNGQVIQELDKAQADAGADALDVNVGPASRDAVGALLWLVENIRTNLMSLPDDTRVLPGHGPETTIGNEKKNNPFLT